MIEPEFLSSPEKASNAESAAVMLESINLALYGNPDPWNIDSLYGDNARDVPVIERGYQSYATSVLTGERMLVKYDPTSRNTLLVGSEQPIHVSSILIGGDEYSVYAKTQDYHSSYADDVEDSLTQLFDLLEDNEGAEEIIMARAMDLTQLPKDFTVEVYKNLPRDPWFLKTVGKFGLEFADMALEGDERVSLIANAEGNIVESEQGEIVRNLEVSTGVSTIDSETAQMLARRLRDEFVADYR